MSTFSRTLIDRSGYERQGFADTYDRFRPAPPESVLDILTQVARGADERVVDLGAGTGLSTRAWADRAREVIGVEANAAMVARAAAATHAANVRYVEAFASDTGLEAESADVVTCAQSFHWMDADSVLPEAARLLRRGGVFAAYDYDVPPVIEPEIDAVFERHFAARRDARIRLGLEPGAIRWPKERHLERIRASGSFRFSREILCHGFDTADAARVVGLAESLGGPLALFDGRAPEVDETYEELGRTAARILGQSSTRMIACYRIRLGVR